MTYEHPFECKNCAEVAVLTIPKETTIKDFMSKSNKKCEKCGCSLGKEDESYMSDMSEFGPGMPQG